MIRFLKKVTDFKFLVYLDLSKSAQKAGETSMSNSKKVFFDFIRLSYNHQFHIIIGQKILTVSAKTQLGIVFAKPKLTNFILENETTEKKGWTFSESDKVTGIGGGYNNCSKYSNQLLLVLQPSASVKPG
jgi:hypothetical protein